MRPIWIWPRLHQRIKDSDKLWVVDAKPIKVMGYVLFHIKFNNLQIVKYNIMTQTINNNLFVEKIERVVEPLCLAEDIELVHSECIGGSGAVVIRIFIDKTGGVTIDDCVNMSRQIGDLIDVYMEDIGPYRLEVSSPGPERPLKKKGDFLKFTGNKVRVETFELIDGRKNFTGILKSFSNDVAGLSIDGKTIEIPHGQIKKARLA